MTPDLNVSRMPAEAIPRPGITEPYATIVEVTPAIAKEWWKRRRGTNRRLKTHNVQQYARDQRAGNWRLNNDAIAFDTEGFLQNGHHRLRACINSETTFTTFVHWNVPPDSFITMDVHGKRSMADALTLSGAHFAKIQGPGLLWCWRFANQKMLGDVDATYDDQKALYEANQPVYDAAAQMVSDLKLNGIVASSLAFFAASVFTQVNPTRTEEFFSGLASGAIGTNPHHPVLQLRNFLMKANRIKRLRITQQETITLLFKVWDAFIGGKNIKQLKAPSTVELKKILMQAPLLYGRNASKA